LIYIEHLKGERMKYVIGFVVGLLIAALVVYFFICEKPTKGTKLHASGLPSSFDEIVWKPLNEDAWSPDGRNQVLKIITQMEGKLKDANEGGKLGKDGTEAIMKVFGRNGTFVGHDGETYHGGKKIKKYFDKIVSDPDRSLSNIQFKLEVVYAEEFDWNRDGGGADDPLHPIYFVISCAYYLDGVRYDPPGSTHCVHIRSCDCEI
jgi:hypothetical protein